MGDDSSAHESPVAERASDGARASAGQTLCSSAARQPRVPMGETTPLFSAAQRGELTEVERILSVSPADLETKEHLSVGERIARLRRDIVASHGVHVRLPRNDAVFLIDWT